MSFDFEELGEQLIKLRKSKMTQKELAEKLDIHPTAVTRYERLKWRSAAHERVAEVAKALGVEIILSVTVNDYGEFGGHCGY